MNTLGNANDIKTGQYYWLASPYYFNYFNAYGRRVATNGYMLSNYVISVDGAVGVRPAVSLTPGIEYYEGNGRMDNPYKIDLERTWELNN